jgi:hypothetical protein
MLLILVFSWCDVSIDLSAGLQSNLQMAKRTEVTIYRAELVKVTAASAKCGNAFVVLTV